MEFYHYFLIFIKAIVGIQFVLIFLKKESSDNELFIITDTIFTIGIALFIMSYFTLLNTNAVINYHEKSFFIAAGFLLLLNIDYIKVNSILEKYIK
jgi:hypothetical protein